MQLQPNLRGEIQQCKVCHVHAHTHRTAIDAAADATAIAAGRISIATVIVLVPGRRDDSTVWSLRQSDFILPCYLQWLACRGVLRKFVSQSCTR